MLIIYEPDKKGEYLGVPKSGHDSNYNDIAFSISC